MAWQKEFAKNTATRKASAVLFAAAWALLPLAPSPASAETGVTNIINGIASNSPSTYFVGPNSSFNALIVTNAGVLNGSGNSIIGDSAYASTNYAWAQLLIARTWAVSLGS